jgi:hypothetical protein
MYRVASKFSKNHIKHFLNIVYFLYYKYFYFLKFYFKDIF